MDKNMLVNQIVDSITASGKKFNEISKDSIFSLLKRSGVSQTDWTSIYEKLENLYYPKNKEIKEDKRGLSTNVDYSDSSHNDVKTRQPRKSVFGDIKKIAG